MENSDSIVEGRGEVVVADQTARMERMLYLRALKGGWRLPHGKKKEIVQKMAEIAISAPSIRDKIGAAHVVVLCESQDQRDRHFDILNERKDKGLEDQVIHHDVQVKQIDLDEYRQRRFIESEPVQAPESEPKP